MRDVVAPCSLGRQRLEVLVIGDDECPLRDLAVQLRDGGRAQDDKTCARGRCAFDGVPPDAGVRLSLVELDADAWEPIAQVPLRPDLTPGTAGAWRSCAPPVDAPPTTHTVADGECLLRMGYERGFLPETIWSYRHNAAVWGKYHTKAILSSGLVVANLGGGFGYQASRPEEIKEAIVTMIANADADLVALIELKKTGPRFSKPEEPALPKSLI